MRNRIQQTFEGLAGPKDIFGGSLLTSHPKTKRPLDSKFATHLVLRANQSRLRRPGQLHKVNEMVRTISKKHGVRLYEYANAGNHLHLLLKLRNRRSWAAFIRELTGRIAQVTGTRWAHRPFTRIVRGWKKPYLIVKEYVRLNLMEAEGYMSRERFKRLRALAGYLEPSARSG